MSHKRVAIVQSSYIPWKGYFDLIRAADEFILLDDVQFTKRDWRSRNRIKTKDGPAWLTIPVQTKGRVDQNILDVTISDPLWSVRHWRTLQSAYARAPFFDRYAKVLEPMYASPPSDNLSQVNHSFICGICGILGIDTPITWSSDYHPCRGRNERLVDLCLKAGATEYLSGPSAREYLEVAVFADAGINVRFADYQGYPEYDQLFPPFEHAVTILDLVFSVGPRTLEFMKDVCPSPSPA